MRMVFGVLSLLIVVAIIGVVAKNQLKSAAPSSAAATQAGVVAPTGTPKQQVEQVKQSVENALQQARPVDDTK
jgi:Na+-transporting methylmalonyl-CoA/oxaloacetate decarboxylase gamma subunit